MADSQVRAIVRGVEKLAERVIVKITLDVTANLVETTPVDTGWARANWVPSVGAPFRADFGDIKASAANAASAAQSQQAAISALASGYRLTRGSAFVTNNVFYIKLLNDGSSSQAPSGFVQRAIAKAITQDIRNFR